MTEPAGVVSAGGCELSLAENRMVFVCGDAGGGGRDCVCSARIRGGSGGRSPLRNQQHQQIDVNREVALGIMALTIASGRGAKPAMATMAKPRHAGVEVTLQEGPPMEATDPDALVSF
jgi:hypothetical protein